MELVFRIVRTRSGWILPSLILVAMMVIPLALPLPAMAQGGALTGVVVDPDGLAPPPGTVVKLLRPDQSTFGTANADPGDGSFSFAYVPNGNYILRAVPPEPSPFAPSVPVPVSVLGAPVDVGDVALTEPSVLGTVTAPDGLTPTSAWIHIHSAGHAEQISPATGGNIKVGGLPAGTYVLQAWPMDHEPSGPFWASQRVSVTVTSGVSQTISLALSAADVYGVAVDSVGTPVKEAVARVVGPHGHVAGRDVTDANGRFAIGGLAPGDYGLTLEPPWWQAALVPPAPVRFSVPPRQDLGAIAFGASRKVVSGKVETNTAQPVGRALIDAHRLDRAGQARTLSDAGGRYTMQLSEGLWSLTVKPISTTVPANWVYVHGPQVVHFQHDTSNEHRTVDFKTLTADSNVTGTVEMPDGSVPPFTVTVGIHTDAGIGRSQEIDPGDGSFDIPVPHGGYKVTVKANDPGYMGPVVDPIRVLPNSTYDLGNLTLLERNAIISGTLTDGIDPVEGVPVVAWRPDAPGWAETRSGPDGGYVLPVVEGDWLVEPAPAPQQAWLYAGRPEAVEVPDGGLVPDVDFVLTSADAHLSGLVVDGEGAPVVDVRGWANAVNRDDPAVQKGAPLEDGALSLWLPEGVYRVSLMLPEGSRWLAGPPQQAQVTSSITTVVTLTVQAKDAAIAGALWDPGREEVVTGVHAEVMAFRAAPGGGTWAGTAVNPGNGTYKLGVAPGVWALGYTVDPGSNYVALRHRRNYPVASGQTVPAPLPVAEKDGEITGIVLDPNGDPLPGATVIADGLGGMLGDLNLHTRSLEDGRFRLAVPNGSYLVRAAGEPDQSWIHPVSVHVRVPPHGSVTGLRLQFTAPDATISGTVTLEGGGVPTNSAKLWAYSMADGYAHTRTGPGGLYTLNVISNTVWHVGGAYQEGNQYWIARDRVEVPPGGATLDLELHGPFPLPAPVTVSFDASQEQYVELADGTSIYVPAGAMPVSGTVTLHITPIATFPHQRHANVYRYGYAFTAAGPNGQPIEQNFNQDVLITFPYDEVELHRMGISEQWLKPAYFSTTTDSWTFPESYVVDTVQDVVAMQIDHFTDFALTGPAGYRLFLPMIVR